MKKFLRKSLKAAKNLAKDKRVLKIAVLFIIIASLYLGRSLFFAAWVGNRPILRLSLVKELEKQGGKSVLDALIEKSLINQAAAKANVNISNDAINLEILNIEELVKKQGISLDAALASRGQTKKDLIEQIKLQKTVEQILKDKIVLSDEELKVENKDEIIQSKLQTEYAKWITELKEKAKIFYFVKY